MDTSLFLFTLVICLLASTESVQWTVAASNIEPAHNDVYQQLLDRVENLELRDQEQQNEIDSLRSELHSEKQRTSKLEEIISTLKNSGGQGNASDRHAQNNAAKTNLPDAAITNTAAFRKRIRSHDPTTHLRSERKTVNHVPRIRRHGDTPVIAFYATLTNHVEHAGMNQIIVFDHDITNIGGGYNPHVGSFVAPVSGVYVISATVMGANHTESFSCFLYIDGLIEGKLYVRNEESPYVSDSITIVFYLAKGDDVVLKIRNSDVTIYGGEYSMFTGFLLHSEDPTPVITGK